MESNSTALPRLGMSQWVIYSHPRDYPGKFVARRWDVFQGGVIETDEIFVADSLVEIRKAIPRHLYRLERFAGDDPCILEVWV